MGILDSMIGGAVGAELSGAVQGLITKHGGVQGMIKEFEAKGLGGTIQSWVGNSANEPITPAQVTQVAGDDTLASLAAKAGMTPAELAQKLATVLPKAVDTLTPGGVIPERDTVAG
jgi:uncharacterized protein YidB (DUF937 family)